MRHTFAAENPLFMNGARNLLNKGSNVRRIKGIAGGNMKNLIIAALAAAQVMDWWYVYCRSGEDAVYCTLTLFFFFLLLMYWLDKQVEKWKRIRDTGRRIERAMNIKKEGPPEGDNRQTI